MLKLKSTKNINEISLIQTHQHIVLWVLRKKVKMWETPPQLDKKVTVVSSIYLSSLVDFSTYGPTNNLILASNHEHYHVFTTLSTQSQLYHIHRNLGF